MNAIQMLEDAGFATDEACNADAAMEIFELRSDIRVVFSDINMPGTLDGLRLARLVRGRWPPIHLILTSGLTCPSAEDLPANGRFIRKPYSARARHCHPSRPFGPKSSSDAPAQSGLIFALALIAVVFRVK